MTGYRRHALFSPTLLFLLPIYFQLVASVLVNRTLDDSATGRAIQYRPTTAGTWKNERCSDCALIPDVNRAFRNTFTSATLDPQSKAEQSITIEFSGTSIWIFFILASNARTGITDRTDVDFIMDGQRPVHFAHTGANRNNFDYDQLVYSRADMVDGPHVLRIVPSSPDTENTFICFDYAIYTQDDGTGVLPVPPVTSNPSSSSSLPISTSSSSSVLPSTSDEPLTSQTNTAVGAVTTDTPAPSTDSTSTDVPSSSGSSAGAIAGGIAGALAFLLATSLIGCFLIRRRQRRRVATSGADDFFEPKPATAQHHERVQPFFVPARRPTTPSGVVSSYGSSYGGYGSSNAHNYPPSEAYASTAGFAGLGAGRNGPEGYGAGGHGTGGYGTGGYGTGGYGAIGYGGAYPQESQVALTAADSTSDPDDNHWREEVRRQRQSELEERMQTIQNQLSNFSTTTKGRQFVAVNRSSASTNAPSDYGGTGTERSVVESRLRAMEDEIAYLREHQHSEWAQGLTDDPPPGYTPRKSMAAPGHDTSAPARF